jgi:hypothetical protein
VVGDRSYEQPVTVRLDPTVKVAPEALAQQQQLALQLRDLQSAVNDTLRALDARRAELVARKRAAEAIPGGEGKAVAEQLGAEMEAIDGLFDILIKPVTRPYWSEGPRLANEVGDLLRKIEAVYAVPTASQQGLSVTLATELRGALEAVARQLGRMGITM